MSKTKTIATIVLSAVLMVGLIVVVTIAAQSQQMEVCSGYDVRIKNTGPGMLKPKSVDKLLKYRNLDPTGKMCDSVNLKRIEDDILTIPLVAGVECYFAENGKMIIEITERMPLFRVKTRTSDYCIDTEGKQMNTPETLTDSLFTISGDVTICYATQELYPLVKYLKEKKAFHDEFSGMQVGRGNQITMKSQRYGYTVVLGPAERYEQKLDKLIRFRKYDKDGELQARYQSIGLQFRGQVVCKKKSN